MEEWFEFFNSKSIDGLKFLLQRKLKKTRLIEQQIEEIKQKLEPHKESTDFKRLATQLNKDLIAKDLEVQQRKMKKYQRDISDYKNDQVFKWQSKIEQPQSNSTYSTPEREVRIQDPTTSHIYNPPRWEDRDAYTETPRPCHEQRNNNGYGNQTPRRTGKKPFKKSFKKPFNNWQHNGRNQIDNREPPY